jgi:hypothetical protein
MKQQQQQQQQQQTTALLCEYFLCSCLVNPGASSSGGCMHACMHAYSIPTNQTINETTTTNCTAAMMLCGNTLCN